MFGKKEFAFLLKKKKKKKLFLLQWENQFSVLKTLQENVKSSVTIK